jgi:hypothetical protein
MTNKFLQQLLKNDKLQEGVYTVLRNSCENFYNSAIELFKMADALAAQRELIRQALALELKQIAISDEESKDNQENNWRFDFNKRVFSGV